MAQPKSNATKAHSAGIVGAVAGALATILNEQMALGLDGAGMAGFVAAMTGILAWVAAWLPRNTPKET